MFSVKAYVERTFYEAEDHITGICVIDVDHIVAAAQELTPEKAASLQPFNRIYVTGHFNSIGDAGDAVSRRADEEGADFYYIQAYGDTSSSSGNWRVAADIYHKNAPAASTATQYRYYNGVKELPKSEANLLEPFDTVTIKGCITASPM